MFEKVKAIMSEKFGSFEECFKVLCVDHSQGLDSGKFATILGWVFLLSLFSCFIVVEDDVGLAVVLEDVGYDCF